MNELTVTLYQQDIRWNDPESNRLHAEETLANTVASAAGTDIFVVPETFTTGFGDHMATLAEEPEGPTLQWARRMAAQYNLLFVGTWIVREGNQCFNRMHLVYPDGSLGTYDKAHTFRVSGESDIIARGTSRKVYEYKGWRIKPAICYDLRFPMWLRNEPAVRADLRGIGARDIDAEIAAMTDLLSYDILLVSANWPGSRHQAWTTLIKARAIENLCYVVGCNRCGTDEHGSDYHGDSAIIDYKGYYVVEDTTYGPHVIASTLRKDKLDTFRRKWPFFLDFD